MEHVWTEATCTDGNGGSLELAHLAWQLEEFQSLFQGDGFDALVGRQLGKLWLVLVVGCTYLNHRTEAAYLHEHRATALRVVA